MTISRLSNNCRRVYVMHREEGLCYPEISVRISISLSMVEKHMSKAIPLMKKDLITNCEVLLVQVTINKLL
ncbi:sigma factor-like helix-turn-helix DNA-binding protein [Chitinophaga sp. 22321]|uniref:RNA polymerase sigma factor 70 region 4 type 2 domain-containing protein n=1 Tax=Chitinophaga hostae TaxID=2831022 RepID=A0ABS5J140_9BACT|nr:hypothetical protein [Chitinophaga hostae]